MSDKLGPIAFEKVQQQFLEGLTNPRRAVSPKIAEEIDREVKEIVEGAHRIALAILDKNRDLLEETAQALLEKEILEGEELKERLKRVQKTPEMDEWLLTGQLSEAIPFPSTFNGGQRIGSATSES
jgi:cell division protease FtsH